MSRRDDAKRKFDAPPRRSFERKKTREKLLWALLCVVAAMGAALGVRAGLTVVELPGWLAWGAIGAAMALGTLAFAFARPEARWNALGLAVVLGVVAGATAHTVVAPSGRIERSDPDRIVAARVLRLGQALERQAYRTGREPTATKYPTNAEFVRFVNELALPDDPLRSPWGGPPQATHVPASRAMGLPTAADLVAEVEVPPLQSRIGPGTPPGAGPYTARTFGALVYDHDPKSDTFVLYGIGRSVDEAVLVGVARSRP